MPTFARRILSSVNGVDVGVYEIDLASAEELNRLKENLKTRIRKIKAHQGLSQYSTYTAVPNLKPEFVERINEIITSITRPGAHGLPWFDVRRTRVTEFMAELLLEKEFGCIFFDEAEKRMSITPDELYRNTQGIDVPGIQNSREGFKFVVCEVKASDSDRIPSSSSGDLLSDIRKSYEDEGKRLSKEVLGYFTKLSGLNVDEGVVKNVTSFLLDVLSKSNSRELMLRNIIFFPFLIRNNSRILAESNLNDFRDFNADDFRDTTIKGLIWLFNQNITTFCNDLYSEAIS